MSNIEISKINIDETQLLIKDAKNRQDLTSLSTKVQSISTNLTNLSASISTDLNSLSTFISTNYLPISGGTLTGSLTTSLQLTIKDDRIDTNNPPESDQWPRHFVIKDKDDTDRGYFELYQQSNGTQGIQIETKRIINNENIFNTLRLGIKEDGERIVNISSDARTAWQEALGVISNSNGTMTGFLNIVGPTNVAGININNETTNYRGLSIRHTYDFNNDISRPYFYSFKSDDAHYDLYRLPRTTISETTNYTYDILTTKDTITIKQGGTGLTASPSMLVDLGSTSAANILSASPRPGITGTLGINHGGTGQTKILATTGTNNSGATSGVINIYKWGKFVNIIADPVIYLATAVGAAESATIGTIPSGYRPKHAIRDVGGSYNNKGDIVISTAGVISFTGNGTAKAAIHNIYFNITYVID